MLADLGGTDWTVVGIIAPACVALIGACAHLVVSRMNRQSEKFEDFRKAMHSQLGAMRDRLSRAESQYEQLKMLYEHNFPQMWECIRALERWKSGMCVRCDKCEKEQSESKGGS